jgi:hypothetical protein
VVFLFASAGVCATLKVSPVVRRDGSSSESDGNCIIDSIQDDSNSSSHFEPSIPFCLIKVGCSLLIF